MSVPHSLHGPQPDETRWLDECARRITELEPEISVAAAGRIAERMWQTNPRAKPAAAAEFWCYGDGTEGVPRGPASEPAERGRPGAVNRQPPSTPPHTHFRR